MAIAPTPNTVRCAEILDANNAGLMVGWRAIRRPIPDDEPPCNLGCLAPGSSPHRHRDHIGYELIGHTAIVDTDTNLEVMAVSVIHPFDPI